MLSAAIPAAAAADGADQAAPRDRRRAGLRRRQRVLGGVGDPHHLDPLAERPEDALAAEGVAATIGRS